MFVVAVYNLLFAFFRIKAPPITGLNEARPVEGVTTIGAPRLPFPVNTEATLPS